MRARFYFPLMALVGAAIIAYSLKPLYVKSAINGAGFSVTAKGILIDGKQLNNIISYDDKNFAVSNAPGTANPQYGPRIVAINPDDKLGDGVVFNLPQAVKDKLASKPAKSVVIVYHNENTARAGLVSFAFKDKNGTLSEFKAINPQGEKKVRFSFGAETKALDKIIINPAIEGEYHGIEIMTVLIEN